MKLFTYRKVKVKINNLETELKELTNSYSHKMTMTKKANLFARKNVLTFAIDNLKDLL